MKKDSPISERRARGRPRSFDTDQALRRVLEVFWERGFAASSLDDLAAAAGLNRPNLAAAFGDKRALYLAALDRFRDDLRRVCGTLQDGPGPLQDRLAAFYTAAIELYTSGASGQLGCFIMCTAAAESARDPDVRRFLRDVQEEIDAAFEACFERAWRADQLRAGPDTKTHGQMATAVLQTLALRARSGTPKESLLTLAHAATVLLACGGDVRS